MTQSLWGYTHLSFFLCPVAPLTFQAGTYLMKPGSSLALLSTTLVLEHQPNFPLSGQLLAPVFTVMVVCVYRLPLFGTLHVRRQLMVGCILSVVQQRQEGIVTGRVLLSVP